MGKKQIVMVKDPHVGSMAASVLLKRIYERKKLAQWLAFRDRLMDAAEAKDGKLICKYCDRDDLVREVPDNVRKPSNLATIDHVVPRSKGGPDEEDNCVIACYPCNQRKADKDTI